MAEDLTEYLHEQGVRVRYMHSDIDTLERIEILRDLRLGAFDVLVGINLLREGLDIPECGFVAILDADKEGFLRSETSLIQTIGRAARNVDGKVILYADQITGSMERAMAETNRRREKQMAWNEANGITPESVKSRISDILDSVYEKDHVRADISDFADATATWSATTSRRISKHLQKQMRDAAADLDFEKAARLRDEIKRLREMELAISDDPLARDVEARKPGLGPREGQAQQGRGQASHGRGAGAFPQARCGARGGSGQGRAAEPVPQADLDEMGADGARRQDAAVRQTLARRHGSRHRRGDAGRRRLALAVQEAVGRRGARVRLRRPRRCRQIAVPQELARRDDGAPHRKAGRGKSAGQAVFLSPCGRG